LSAWARFENHRRGHKSAKVVCRHARGLRPELYEGLPELPDPECEALEKSYAERLRDAGYRTYVNGKLGKWLDPVKPLAPFELDELPDQQRVHLDRAINAVIGNPLRRLSPMQCENVLRGSRGPKMVEWRLTELPGHGASAHLAQHVIRDRIYELTDKGFISRDPAGPTPNAVRLTTPAEAEIRR
jgi:hypothetical protein